MKLVQEEEFLRKTVDRRDSISSQDESQDTLEVSLRCRSTLVEL